MTLLLKTTADLGEELPDVLWHSLHNFDSCEDSILPNVSRAVADTLTSMLFTLRTSKCRSLANSAVHISERTHRTSPTMLLLLLLRSILILLVAIISSSDFSWNSWVRPTSPILYLGNLPSSRWGNEQWWVWGTPSVRSWFPARTCWWIATWSRCEVAESPHFSDWQQRYGKGLTNGSHFLLIFSPFFGLSLAVPDFGDELVKSDHLNISNFELQQHINPIPTPIPPSHHNLHNYNNPSSYIKLLALTDKQQSDYLLRRTSRRAELD